MVVVNQCVNSIYGFDCSNIVRSNKKEFQIVKLSSYYAYLITAQVVDRNKGLVRIGMLFIYLDAPIPKDILNGNYVTFKVMRMDCVIN